MSENLGDVMRDAAQAKERVVYEYGIPESLRNQHVTQSIGLVKLTGREEKQAIKKSRGDSTMLAFELVKAAIYEVDGRRINRGKHEDEIVWDSIDPKLRNLILAGYADLHSPEDDETENFLAGRKEKVG